MMATGEKLEGHLGKVPKSQVRTVYTQAEFEEALADSATLEIHLNSNLNTVFAITDAHERSRQVSVRAMGAVQVRVSGGRLIAHDNAHVTAAGNTLLVLESAQVVYDVSDTVRVIREY